MFGLSEMMMSFLRRQVGLRTDVADAAGSLHAKAANINTNVSNLPTSIWNAVNRALSKVAPSDTLRIASDTERSVGSTSYSKIKEIKVRASGIMRVKFDLRHGQELFTSYGRIYRNGTAYGTERARSTATYATFSEDLFFEEGDLVQLYAKYNDSGGGTVRNFRIYWDYSVDPYYGSVNQD